MILYENIDFAVNAKASDYDFIAIENFMHEWSLRVQKYIPSGSVNHLSYKKLIVEATSLDEIKVWLDMHIPGVETLYEMKYGEFLKRSKI